MLYLGKKAEAVKVPLRSVPPVRWLELKLTDRFTPAGLRNVMLIELIIERLSVAVTVTAGDWSETLVSMEGGLIEMIPVNSGQPCRLHHRRKSGPGDRRGRRPMLDW